MNKRATTWLLAALMSLCAAHAVPPVRVQRTPENCAIVWIARVWAEQRVSLERRGEYRRASILVPKPEKQHRARLFSKSLYQRPPPFSLL